MEFLPLRRRRSSSRNVPSIDEGKRLSSQAREKWAVFFRRLFSLFLVVNSLLLQATAQACSRCGILSQQASCRVSKNCVCPNNPTKHSYQELYLKIFVFKIIQILPSARLLILTRLALNFLGCGYCFFFFFLIWARKWSHNHPETAGLSILPLIFFLLVVRGHV